jgi:uncharacterized membrane protein YedE/YeeE
MEMDLSEYQAHLECRYREDVVIPRAERRAALEGELRTLRGKPVPPAPRRSLGALLGGLMVSLGERLGSGGPTQAAGAS